MAKIKNRGQVALRKCGHNQEQIARATGASFSLVGNWLTGDKRPGEAYRAKLLELYGLDPTWWDEPPPKVERKATGLLGKAATAPEPPSAARASAPTKPVTTGDVLAEAEALIAQVREWREEIKRDPVSSNVEKTRVLTACGVALSQAYKLTGGNADMPESKLMQTPAWRRVQAAIIEALEPWPDAMRAVADRLDALG